MTYIRRATKTEIRKYVAAEIRGALAENAPEFASQEAQAVWREYCQEIAQQISPVYLRPSAFESTDYEADAEHACDHISE
jgi:hypothetical protein